VRYTERWSAAAIVLARQSLSDQLQGFSNSRRVSSGRLVSAEVTHGHESSTSELGLRWREKVGPTAPYCLGIAIQGSVIRVDFTDHIRSAPDWNALHRVLLSAPNRQEEETARSFPLALARRTTSGHGEATGRVISSTTRFRVVGLDARQRLAHRRMFPRRTISQPPSFSMRARTESRNITWPNGPGRSELPTDCSSTQREHGRRSSPRPTLVHQTVVMLSAESW
jgi:hypothetical protein